MKKTLLLTIALLFSTTIFAQLIDEKFDSTELPEVGASSARLRKTGR
jgi:hypothetical protein